MHELADFTEALLLLLSLALVFASSEPGQTFFVDINPQGVNTGDRDINPQIKLIAIER